MTNKTSNSWYCWWKKSCTTWDLKKPVNNVNTYQLVQDFFHQQYSMEIVWRICKECLIVTNLAAYDRGIPWIPAEKELKPSNQVPTSNNSLLITPLKLKYPHPQGMFESIMFLTFPLCWVPFCFAFPLGICTNFPTLTHYIQLQGTTGSLLNARCVPPSKIQKPGRSPIGCSFSKDSTELPGLLGPGPHSRNWCSIDTCRLFGGKLFFLLEKDANEMSHRWQKLAIWFNWKFPRAQFIYTTGNSKGSIKTHPLFTKDFQKIGSYFSHPGDSIRDLLIPQVGGHLTLERVTFSPSQKGHGLTHLDLGIFRISQLGYPTKLVNG